MLMPACDKYTFFVFIILCRRWRERERMKKETARCPQHEGTMYNLAEAETIFHNNYLLKIVGRSPFLWFLSISFTVVEKCASQPYSFFLHYFILLS
jgi:hypothetical protein